MKWISTTFAMVLFVAGFAAPVRASGSLHVAARLDSLLNYPFDSQRAISLDQFLESAPGYFLARRGPLGGTSDLSRLGMGRGRAQVFFRDVPLNDPQTQTAPLYLLPETFVSRLLFDAASNVSPAFGSWLEGRLQIVHHQPPVDRPLTAIDVSTGDRGLDQRRVRYASAAGAFGIDFTYDELAHDGYRFDSRTPSAGALGGSSTRLQGFNVRGQVGEGDYLFSYRRFMNTFEGDLASPNTQFRNAGHFSLVQGDHGALRWSVYERGFRVDAPDSLTRNQSLGTVFSATRAGDRFSATFAARLEETASREVIGATTSVSRLRDFGTGLNGGARLTPGLSFMYAWNVSVLEETGLGVGGRAALTASILNDDAITFSLARTSRFPSLQERFAPRHSVAATTNVQGNPDVEVETGIEAAVLLQNGWRLLSNGVRVAWVRVDNPIDFVPDDANASVVELVSRNGGAEERVVVEHRLRLGASLRRLRVNAASTFEFASGDDGTFFAGTPEARWHGTLELSHPVFGSTSDVALRADYTFTGERTDAGRVLAQYSVLDLGVTFNIVDAVLYATWLNLLDESYETRFPYLMTPKTFSFGVTWTLFD